MSNEKLCHPCSQLTSQKYHFEGWKNVGGDCNRCGAMILPKSKRARMCESKIAIPKKTREMINDKTCEYCLQNFRTKNEVSSHIKQIHESEIRKYVGNLSLQAQHPIEVKSSAFDGAVRYIDLKSGDTSETDIDSYVNQRVNSLHSIIFMKQISKFTRKCGLSVQIELKHPNQSEAVKTEDFHICSKFKIVNDFNFEQWINDFISEVHKRLDTYVCEKSGLVIQRIVNLRLSILIVPDYTGGCYEVVIPERIRLRKWWISIGLRDGNNKNDCFILSVLACLAKQKGLLKARSHPTATQLYKWLISGEIVLKHWDNYTLPMKISDIAKFEKENNIIIRVWVYTNSFQGLANPKSSQIQNPDVPIIHLLLIYDADRCNGHYVPVIDFHSMGIYFRKLPDGKAYICDNCLHYSYSYDNYQIHRRHCIQGKTPYELSGHSDGKIKFRDYGKMTQPLAVVYADIESTINRESGKHDPIYVGCLVKWHKKALIEEKLDVHLFNGEYCVFHFIQFLKQCLQRIQLYSSTTRKPMSSLTEEQRQSFEESTQCNICMEPFGSMRKIANKHVKLVKCRDHDHVSGHYLQALCQFCNRARRQSRNKLVVVFHNWRSYDSHHVITHGIEHFNSTDETDGDKWDLHIINNSLEKCMTLSATTKFPIASNLDLNEPSDDDDEVDDVENDENVAPNSSHLMNSIKLKNATESFKIQFIDSLQHLKGSLRTLSDMLNGDLPITKSVLQRIYGNDIPSDLISHKGVFPYNWLDSKERLSDTSLPPIEDFYDLLTELECSKEDYDKASKIFNSLPNKTMDEYLKLYLRLDVLLLADVFETYRQKRWEEDQLDPVHFLGLPSYTISNCLKRGNIEMDALVDLDMYEFFENGVRGGMTTVVKHYAKAEPNESIIEYYDQNNMYGFCLSDLLPHSKFEWLQKHELASFEDSTFILQLDTESETGYTLEVDLHYPIETQSTTLDFPLAPHVGSLEWSEFTPYMKKLWDDQCIQRFGRVMPYKSSPKLLLSHLDKERYILHISALKYYVERGLRITKVHRGIKYTQKKIFEPFVRYHSDKRAKAEDDFTKNYHKLSLNSLYGKTLENPRKYSKHKIAITKSNIWKWSMNPFLKNVSIIKENVVIVALLPTPVKLDKPVFVGQTVLDLSKLIMYRMFETIRSCPLIDSVSLIGGDTDSLMLHLFTKFCKEDILRHMKKYVDSSNYPKDHPLYSEINRAKLGCFKDETKGRSILEFIALCPKMYSFIYSDDKVTGVKRMKGIKDYKKREISHDDYKDTYQSNLQKKISQNLFQSKLHCISNTQQNKFALSMMDTKRVWIDSNVSYPIGNKSHLGNFESLVNTNERPS